MHNYPKSKLSNQFVHAALAVIDTPLNRDAIAQAVAKWDPYELEQNAADAGTALCVVRTDVEFRAHQQGQATLAEPLVAIEKIADSEPEPFGPATRPLTGLRVLQDTMAIAGTVVGRTLAEQGAEVLHVNGPNEVELDVNWNEVGVGMRSARLDITEADGAARTRELLGGADVFVENRRGSAIQRAGFGPDEAAQTRPGIIYCSVKAYGHSGPWYERAGFDQQGLALTGFCVSEGTEDQPKFPPTGLLNDFVAGYLGAAGVIAALARRAKEGGSYHVKLSLSRCSAWYSTLGLLDKNAIDFDGAPHHLMAPDLMTEQTPLGELRRLAPALGYSKTPSAWATPLLVPRGSSRAEWLDR